MAATSRHAVPMRTALSPASVLGIDRSTLYDKLKKYGIER